MFCLLFCWQVSYGATSSVLSKKQNYPSFFRTVHPNNDVIEVIVKILQHFNWRWVAFLNSDNDFGIDGRDIFRKRIANTQICLAYTKNLNTQTDYGQIFAQIEAQRVKIIIVLAPKMIAEALVVSAIKMNITEKVWIADDGWSLNKNLPKQKGIKNIGTVIGLAQAVQPIPGFNEFVYSTKSKMHCESENGLFCNQFCKCSSFTAEDITAADPTFSFSVYSAVYAIANALHRTLQCETGYCKRKTAVYPYMVSTRCPLHSGNVQKAFENEVSQQSFGKDYTNAVPQLQVLGELKKTNFTLLNQIIRFDENGNPKFGSYSIVFWNYSGDPEEIGSYHFPKLSYFFINNTKIHWFANGEVSCHFT